MIIIIKILSFLLLKAYLNVVLLTCRWKTNNMSVLQKAISSKSPIMLSCWHENLVLFACFFKKFKKPIWVISSTHRDSQILGKVLASWKYKLIKGSSTRGWLAVIKKLIIVFKKQNEIVAITHDGPTGPAKKSKPGAIKIAIKNNVQIIGMSGAPNSFWRLGSWDRTILPKPFTTIHIYFYPPYSNDDSIKNFDLYLNVNENQRNHQ